MHMHIHISTRLIAIHPLYEDDGEEHAYTDNHL